MPAEQPKPGMPGKRQDIYNTQECRNRRADNTEMR